MKSKENTILCRVDTGLGPVDLMHARYVTQAFAPHFHEGYCLGVIEKGALGFRYMGEQAVAPAGAVNLAIPGEAHTGQAADEAGWTYRMFYLDADLIAKAADQMAGKPTPLPFIREGVLFDPDLARMIRRLHRRMQNPLAAGFFDQSHLSRHFKRIVGVTPGRYRNSVQDIPDVRR